MSRPKNHSLDLSNSSRELVLEKFFDVSAQIGELARRTIEMEAPEEADAIAVFLGLGEHARLERAVSWWTTGRYRHLLIGGVNPNEADAPNEDEIRRNGPVPHTDTPRMTENRCRLVLIVPEIADPVACAEVLGNALVAMVGLYVAAAVYHAVVLKDKVLQSMVGRA